MGLLRVLLALCVFCSHAGSLANLHWRAGILSVELFFIISGFYMQLVLRTKYTEARLGFSWARQFYIARYFRLFPAYIAGFLLVLSLALISRHGRAFDAWSYIFYLPNTPQNLIFKVFLCFTNLSMLFQEVTLFFACNHGVIHWSANFSNSDLLLWHGLANPQAWSLGVELTFYFIAPYFLRLRSRWLALLAVCCIVAKLSVVLGLHLGDPWTYRFFPFELAYFIAGALAWRFRSQLTIGIPAFWGRILAYSLAVIIALMPLPGQTSKILCPAAVVLFLPSMFEFTAKSKLDRLVGEISYPFYIYHVFAILLAEIIQRHWSLNANTTSWMALALTLALSIATLNLELRFIEPWRARLSLRPKSRPEMEAMPNPALLASRE